MRNVRNENGKYDNPNVEREADPGKETERNGFKCHYVNSTNSSNSNGNYGRLMQCYNK